MPDIQTGIHIGKYFIEVAQLKKGVGGYQLINQGKIEFSKREERVLSTLEISDLLRQVLQDNHIEPLNPITSLPDSQVVLRYFTLPFLPPKERDNAIRFEAQKYIPFKMGEVASSYYVLPARDKKKELRVVFVATKKNILDKHLEILKEANIEPKAVEVSSLTLMRLFRLMGLLSPRYLSAIVYLEKDEAIITLCDQEMPYLMRDFSLNLTVEDLNLGEKISGPYDNLLREIQLSLDYYYKRYPGAVIEKLILVGEDGLEKWRDSLEKDFKIPTVIAEPGNILGGKPKVGSIASTAIGLALRGFLPWDKKINLLEKEEAPLKPEKLEKPVVAEEEKKLLFRTFIGELIVGLMIILVVQLALGHQIKTIKNNFREVRKTREKISKELANADKQELNRLLREWNKKRNVFVHLLDRRIYLTPYLSELPRLLPEGVWLEKMKVDSKTEESGAKLIQLILEGVVFSARHSKSDSDLVNELVANIKNSPIFSPVFKKVELGFMEKDTVDNFSITRFKISCSN